MARSRILWSLVLVVGITACGPKLSRDAEQRLSGARYTCCNLHYESDEITDAHYYVGTLLPAGTPVAIARFGRGSVTFSAAGKSFTLHHEYGAEQESLESYLSKMLPAEDPRPRLAALPARVQSAIREARVEKGMTREEVILSLGYPPTHRTPNLDDREWTYWNNRWTTYKVVFGDDGRVSTFVGGGVPTHGEAVR